jgi:hypothetical protein
MAAAGVPEAVATTQDPLVRAAERRLKARVRP